MKVEVDKTKCVTAGECVKICPEVFQFNCGDKKAEPKVEIISDKYRIQCLRAAEACPAKAITITLR